MCKKAGFPDTRVYLDGKTEDGKTVYKNEDMSPHQHKQGNGQQQKGSTTIITQATQNDIIIKKLDEIISLLGEIMQIITVIVDFFSVIMQLISLFTIIH